MFINLRISKFGMANQVKKFVKCIFISIHGTWIFKVMVTTVVIGSYSVVVPRSTVLIHLVF